MKFTDLHNLDQISPIQLDDYLEKGWFRMGQTMFTTNFLVFEKKQFNAAWLRVDLGKFECTPSQKNLLKQNKKFRVEIAQTQINSERESLYFRYRESLSFSISSSLQSLLLGESMFDIFESLTINVYDENMLIACGVFDVGQKSAQGIVSFFNPDYKKYSLGRYLILQKVLFLQNNGFNYFYPGYFVPGYKHFDYKLNISPKHTEFFDYKYSEWKHIEHFSEENQPLAEIREKLETLLEIFQNLGYFPQLLKYDFFDISLVKNYTEFELLDLPLILFCFTNSPQQDAIIVYNLFKNKYQFLLCNKQFQSNMLEEEGRYTRFLLKVDTVIVESSEIDEFVFRFLEAINF